ncbi:glycoside hydrolase family 68 protein [Novosphingobium sp. 9]|uniref:glycoside hydrolase family 68 protein n=1 Tax=Novosphingobium sp. 9 TaxID=2025349 RepID=UPI0021B6CC98|nr:glycoside hydrolase family 68 protein [Novosphingobium sp. 9]
MTAPLRWTAEHLSGLAAGDVDRAPVIAASDVSRVDAALDVWDAWPLADGRGAPVPWRGGELWFALTAPVLDDPEARHGVARIHHYHRQNGAFLPLGPTFADGFTPGSREWSGSARCDEAGRVTLLFTAAGERGERALSFRQRLFAADTMLREASDGAAFGAWTNLRELVAPQGEFYLSGHDASGRAGEIKAFRDPALHRTAQGEEYLLFTASSARSDSAFNGVIGLARREADGRFRRLPPLVDASGTNNELERPHIVAHGGLLYLFWSTQRHVFAPDIFAPGIAAPTGLYGAVASGIEGPWTLLNGHGLVLANPVCEPFQAYSWWVLPDLSVASFVDYRGLDDSAAIAKPAGRAHFGGGFAPFLHLALDGPRAGLAQARS